MDDWELELNKALEEGRKGNEVTFTEWLKDDCKVTEGGHRDEISLEDKIRQMPYIKDLPDGMIPRIEIGSNNGVVNIIYDHAVGRHPYIYVWAEERSCGKSTGAKFVTWHQIIRDLVKHDDWPWMVMKQAKALLKDATNMDIFRRCTIRLILANKFYDPYSIDYFLDLKPVEV